MRPRSRNMDARLLALVSLASVRMQISSLACVDRNLCQAWVLRRTAVARVQPILMQRQTSGCNLCTARYEHLRLTAEGRLAT